MFDSNEIFSLQLKLNLPIFKEVKHFNSFMIFVINCYCILSIKYVHFTPEYFGDLYRNIFQLPRIQTFCEGKKLFFFSLKLFKVY